MIFVTSDLHGYPLPRFKALLAEAGFGQDDRLYVLGDVIDRNGDGGVEALRWIARQPNVTLLMGNHEAMLLSCAFLFAPDAAESTAALAPDGQSQERLSAWISNGASPTLAALRALREEDPGALADLLKYLAKAPLWAIAYAGGRRFVLTHAGLGGFVPEKPLSAYTSDELLWHRPSLEERYWAEQMTVFGHTPTGLYGPEFTGRMIRTPTWMNIDTGAAAGGAPMVLRLDDLQPFYADETTEQRMR